MRKLQLRVGRRRPLRVQWGLSQRACPSTGAFLNGRRASTASFRTLQVKPQSREARLWLVQYNKAIVDSIDFAPTFLYTACCNACYQPMAAPGMSSSVFNVPCVQFAAIVHDDKVKPRIQRLQALADISRSRYVVITTKRVYRL